MPTRRGELRAVGRMGAGPGQSGRGPGAPDPGKLGHAPRAAVNPVNNLVQEVHVSSEIEEPTALVEGPAFSEREIEADGFRIRVLEAGEGRPVVYFHGGGGLHPSPGLSLLARRFDIHA